MELEFQKISRSMYGLRPKNHEVKRLVDAINELGWNQKKLREETGTRPEAIKSLMRSGRCSKVMFLRFSLVVSVALFTTRREKK